MEAVSKVTSSRTLNELESYFASYGDLPREIILKHDLLRVGHWFTDAAWDLSASQSMAPRAGFRSGLAARATGNPVRVLPRADGQLLRDLEEIRPPRRAA